MRGIRIDRFASVSDYPQFSCGDFCNLLFAELIVFSACKRNSNEWFLLVQIFCVLNFVYCFFVFLSMIMHIFVIVYNMTDTYWTVWEIFLCAIW